MKTFGIVLLIFAALNFIVMLIAMLNNAPYDDVTRKLSAAILLGVGGGCFYYYGVKKNKS